MSEATYYSPSLITELGSLDSAALDARPGLAASLLAIAVGSNSAAERKNAKALIKKSKQPRLQEALKLLPRRAYAKSTKQVDEMMAGDLEALAEIGVDAVTMAYGMTQLYRYEPASRYFSSHASETMIRKAIEDGELTLRGTAWPARIMTILSDYPKLTKVSFVLAEPAEIPASWAGLTALEVIDITGPVTAIDPAVFTLHSLQRLALNGARLTQLPSTITAAPSLNSIRVWGNSLTALPEDIGALSGLVALDILGGPLAVLPESVGQLKRLEWLALRELPELGPLPETLGGLSALTELQLGELTITALPESLGDLKSLERLALRDLELTEVPERIAEIGSCAVRITGSVFKNTGPKASTFLGLPCTARLYAEMLPYLDYCRSHPRFASAIATYEAGADDRAARITEMLLAGTRVYVDDEHGPSTNTYLAKKVQKLGGPLDQAAGRAFLPKTVKSSTNISRFLPQLAALDGFDVPAFEAFLAAALES